MIRNQCNNIITKIENKHNFIEQVHLNPNITRAKTFPTT